MYDADGGERARAHYAVLIKPGETIWTGDGRKLRVLDVIPADEQDSPFAGLLNIEPAG